MKYYITIRIDRSIVTDYLKNLDNFISEIIFFIDIKSISRGFYVDNVIMYEVSNYFDGNAPRKFLDELREFCYFTYNNFRDYRPRFVIFYDNGKNIQNKSIFKDYKSNRIRGDPEINNLRKSLMKHYLDLSKKLFTINGVSTVIDSGDYECDFIPYYLIGEFIYDNNDILNIILSYDKDLLQCCIFENTIQLVPPVARNSKFNIYNKYNCIKYIYKNFGEGILDASHIPLILAISGDIGDNIHGIDRVGPKRACDILTKIRSNNINDLSKYLSDEDFNIVKFNYELISFDKQIERIPIYVLNRIKSDFEKVWRRG